jgi:NAD(P)-dependent dehydrogenase (short-subunit alcohol dehydrogenase family)
VSREQGRIDILVNNACAIHDRLTDPGHFWEKPLEIGNMIDVGVRSGFVASWHAAPMMAAQRSGLIVFTSAPGAVHYVFGPAYGAHKAGVDKMAADMAVDFREFGVAALSIWMGSLATGRVLDLIASDPAKYGRLSDTLETPEYTGHVIWRLFNDPELLSMSGQTVIGAEMGRRYAIADANGRFPPSVRDTLGIAPHVPHPHIIR